MFELLLLSKPKADTGVSYASFLNKIAAMPVMANIAGTTSGYYKTIPTVLSSQMWGTSYKSYFTYDSTLQQAVRHAFPDFNLFNDSVTNRRYCAIRILYVGYLSPYLATNRNGYLSKAYGGYNGTKAVSFIYYDNTTGKMMQYSPFDGNEPVLWDGNFT